MYKCMYDPTGCSRKRKWELWKPPSELLVGEVGRNVCSHGCSGMGSGGHLEVAEAAMGAIGRRYTKIVYVRIILVVYERKK